MGTTITQDDVNCWICDRCGKHFINESDVFSAVFSTFNNADNSVGVSIDMFLCDKCRKELQETICLFADRDGDFN